MLVNLLSTFVGLCNQYFFGSVFGACCFAILLSEFLFYGVIKIIVRYHLNDMRKPLAYDIHPSKLFDRILDDVDRLEGYCHKQFFQGWFCGAKLESVKLGNMKSFLAWVMYASHFSDLCAVKTAELDVMAERISEKYSLCLEHGHNPSISHVKMTLEPLRVNHRPLFLYVLCGLIEICTHAYLMSMGFRKFRVHGVGYWHRPLCGESQISSPTLAPAVLFHGISTGWANYTQLVKRLVSTRETFLFDLDAVKVNSLNFDIHTPDEYADITAHILRRHHVTKASILGHSFGSITAGWFVKKYPSMVSHLTLVDPVSLLLAMPDVAFNFLYRNPSSVMEWLIHLVVSSEVTISNTLRRNFWWYKNVLWLEDLPQSVGVLVSLGGGDEVTNAPLVAQYVQLCRQEREKQKGDPGNKETIAPMRCLFYPGKSHAQMLVEQDCLTDIGQILKEHESYNSIDCT